MKLSLNRSFTKKSQKFVFFYDFLDFHENVYFFRILLSKRKFQIITCETKFWPDCIETGPQSVVNVI